MSLKELIRNIKGASRSRLRTLKESKELIKDIKGALRSRLRRLKEP